MTQRKKLELELNRPTEIKLLYDEPIVGESQYGNYYLYAVESEGTEYSFFAPKEVHEKIANLKKGDTAIITKSAKQQGSRFVASYDVILPEYSNRSNKVQTIDEVLDDVLPSEEEETDSLYEIMLKSLRDAVDIANQLGGIVDVNRIGITLFIARSKVKV